MGAIGAASAVGSCAGEKQEQQAVASVEPHPLAGEAPAIDAEDYQRRMERASDLMRKNSMDCLLVTGGTSMRYFSGVSWGRSERVMAMLMFADREPVFICPAFEEPKLAEMLHGEYPIYPWHEDESPYSKMVDALRDRGHGEARVGVERTVRYFVSQGLREAQAEISLLDGDPVVNGCRGVKTEKELELMRRANQLTVLAWKGLRDRCESGMTEDETRQIAREEFQKLGVPGYGFVLHGPNSAFPHGTKQREKLVDGMVVLVDGGFKLNGFSADITRTWVHGQPTKRQYRVWNLVKEAQQAALEQAKAGVTAGSVDEAARNVISAGGFGPDYKYFTHRLGHGIGMDGHEWPYLVRGNDLVLEPGMTFSNEPGIYIYGEFGVRLEDIMYISEEGPARLFTEASPSLDDPFGLA